jgi:NTP pyrophosphatase (non-canonical NTP hydrolase)
MSLAIEAAELMEHFQWIEAAQSRASNLRPEQLTQIGEEIADVLAYTLAIVNELQLDLTQLFLAKLEGNRRKYPADEYRGRYGASDTNSPGKI